MHTCNSHGPTAIIILRDCKVACPACVQTDNARALDRQLGKLEQELKDAHKLIEDLRRTPWRPASEVPVIGAKMGDPNWESKYWEREGSQP